MFLHQNIRFLRKRHRFSQIELARQLKINRGNIASYESGTNPPVEILVNMAAIFNVSLDILISSNLELLMKNEGLKPLPESISVSDLTHKLQQFIGLLGKDTKGLASLINISEKTINRLIKEQQSADLEVFCRIFSTFSWLNANWLMKGGIENPVRLDESLSTENQLPDAAEAIGKSTTYSFQKTVDDLKKRIEQLEKEAKRPGKK